MSERRACVVIGQSRSTQRLSAPSPSEHEEKLRAFLRDFAKSIPAGAGDVAMTRCVTPAGS